MDWKRPLTAVAILVAGLGSYVLAQSAAQLTLWQAYESGAYTYDVLFESLPWLLPGAVAVGLFLGAVQARGADTPPETRSGKVKRHRAWGWFLEHWTLATGMVVLLASGIWLGFLFVPQQAAGPEGVGLALNVHWAGAAILLFAVAYHLGGLVMGVHRELLPSSSDVGNAIRDIGHYVGLSEQPPAGKYKPIQRVSYLAWAGIILVLAISGLVKAVDYVGTVGGGLKSSMTLVHEVFALLAVLMFVGHVGIVFIPSHLQLLRSQITGWIPQSYVRKHHPEWLPDASREFAHEDD
mgnify:CR=1 FL=1